MYSKLGQDLEQNIVGLSSIEKGRGYVSSEENKKVDAPLGTIPMDSIFTPIKNVTYSIEDYRVEQKTDYEKLIFQIFTDGFIQELLIFVVWRSKKIGRT